MDFWNRLIGATPISPTKTPTPVVVTPQQRLARFRRTWQSLLGSWRNSRDNDTSHHDLFATQIKRLSDQLIEEERRTERTCMQFAYDQKMYIAVSKIAQQAGSPAVIREAITTFSILIENEEEFLSNQSFAESLIEFFASAAGRVTGELEGEFVELLFSVAAKIRLMPGILPVWFTSRGSLEQDYSSLRPEEQFAGITQKEDFPLFYLLIDYVHHEGRVGDFARTGLLYIIESASNSAELERWIVESDLATLMASGLGALYSQLSRKLVVTFEQGETPTILRYSDYVPHPPTFGAESSSSPEFQTHLETFLSYLIFWQDVLEHCKSAEVKQTLLDHFKVLFLQQLLYPSLIESSDHDGGSSVAVLTYVRLILDTLEHVDINHIILTYLLALPERPAASPVPSPSVARRRKSLDLLNQFTSDMEYKPTPDLFNLVDLILTSLKSRSQQTVSATLRLISTILRKHHPYAVSTLLRVKLVPVSMRTIGAHNKEMELLFSLVSSTGEMDVSNSYEAHLKDDLILLENHPCTAATLALRSTPPTSQLSIKSPTHCSSPSNKLAKDVEPHTIRPDDPLLKSVVELLASFFTNSIETNLVLTAVIIDLASCSQMRLEGWLLFDPESYSFPSDSSDDQDLDDDSDPLASELAALISAASSSAEDLLEAANDRAQSRSIRLAQRTPTFTSTPPILETLQALVRQVAAYRREIPDLENLLKQHRAAFAFSDDLNDALGSSPTSVGHQASFSHHQHNSGSQRGRPHTSHASLNTHQQPPRPRSRGFFPFDRSPSPPPLPTPPPQSRPRTAVSSPFGNHVADVRGRKVKVLSPTLFHAPPPPDESIEGGSGSGERGGGGRRATVGETVGRVGDEVFSLSHLLTNVVVLQEFILELAALVQTRAALLGDVVFG